MRLNAQLKTLSVMTIAILCSIFFHAIILSIQFQPELRKLRDYLPVLEVVLVNSKTLAKPENADLHAQSNLDRGGNTDKDLKMKTALPALKEQKSELTLKQEVKTRETAKATDQTKEEKHVVELEQQVQALMTQVNADRKLESEPTKKIASQAAELNHQATPKKLDLDNLTSMALQMERLEAQISKQQEEYQKRPKRKFVGGRTKEYRYAMYVEAWRQKVERIGNLNYPEAAKSLKLYGQLQLTVSIREDGSIEGIEVNRSSGHKVLDEAAKHIVELGAPYARFPEDIRNEVDILSITRTWTFTKEDSLATE
ncbi:MAG: energy transducer TonB [Betaproteobacteria bacterium]|nr:energy transducer TonB [Betaproteobacteria bacterium]